MREARGGARGWSAGAGVGRVYQAHGWRPMKAKGEEGVNECLVGVTSDIRMREKLGSLCLRIFRSTVRRQSRCDCRPKQDGSARTRSPRKDDTRAAQSNLS